MSLTDTIKTDAAEAVKLLETIAEYPVKASQPHVSKLRSIINRLENSLAQHVEHALGDTGGETPAKP